MPIRTLVVGAKAQARLNAANKRLLMWRTLCHEHGLEVTGDDIGSNTLTHVLPYISDNGARNNGPIAKVMRKILRTIAVIVTLVM